MLEQSQVDRIIQAALDEDAPWGDVTSQALVPADRVAMAVLNTREDGVFAGELVFRRTFELCGVTDVEVAADGSRFFAGEVIGKAHGNARAILRAERIALNLVQRMSGIATLTAQFVEAVAGTKAHIVDTRKTTPGLRVLERHAVRSGGGFNHRFSLSDAILAKDNHLALLPSDSAGLTAALREARERVGHTVHFEVEVDRIDQIETVIAAGVDTIMLDNFSIDELHEGVKLVGGRAKVEASGGVNLSTVRAIAETGVDLISVGALTHSARALDLGLDINILGK